MFGVDENGRISFATEAFAARLETTPVHLTGTPLDTVVAARDGTDPREIARSLASFPAGSTRRCQVYLRRGDDPIAATVELATTDQEIVGTVCQPAEPDDRFRHLFEQSSDAIAAFEIVNMVPVVRAVNDAFVETFGYDAKEVVGESLNDYIVPDGQVSEATDYDERTAAGKVNHAIVSRKTVDGRRVFDYRGLPYETEEGRRYGFAIYTDVTADRRRHRRLQVLHRVLRHNLRNDLTVAIGLAEHVRENATDDELAEAAGRILAAAERVDAVSEQARNVECALDSRSDQILDIAALAHAVADEYTETAVTVEAPDMAPATGGTALYAALDNLVENAIEHTPDGTDVRILVDDAGEKLCVRVVDDGPGIPDIERAAVFEDQDITTLQHGSGLGIWLARWVAESAGGDLRYDRVDGETVITLRLPSVGGHHQSRPDDISRSANQPREQ